MLVCVFCFLLWLEQGYALNRVQEVGYEKENFATRYENIAIKGSNELDFISENYIAHASMILSIL